MKLEKKKRLVCFDKAAATDREQISMETKEVLEVMRDHLVGLIDYVENLGLKVFDIRVSPEKSEEAGRLLMMFREYSAVLQTLNAIGLITREELENYAKSFMEKAKTREPREEIDEEQEEYDLTPEDFQ